MKKIFFKSGLPFLFLLLAGLVSAATNDFLADADIAVDGVTFGAATTTLSIENGSAAASWSYSGGELTVTDPDPTNGFKIASVDSAVKSFRVTSSSTLVACQENTVPGTSYVSAPVAAGTYAITPSASTNCQENCVQLPNALSYNHFPTCGAAACADGYYVSGSGASATCASNNYSSGGGGGGYTPPSQQPNATTTSQSYVAEEDGTTVTSNIVAIKVNGVTIQTQVDASINTVASTSKNQEIYLDSFLSSQIKKLSVTLPAAAIQAIVNQYGSDKDIKVSIVSHDASDIQKTNTARNGMFLIGFDVFSVTISVGDKVITAFSEPLNLKFDVSNFIAPDNFKAYFFNAVSGVWEIIPGSVANGGIITAQIDHLTDFGIMRAISPMALEEILDNRITHWQQIMYEAAAVYKSGSNLDEILIHNGKTKDAAMQSEYMAKYTEPLVKGVANLTQAQTYAINNFIVYGSKTAKTLGAGERAGTVGSYKKAFGKLPKTEKEWIDCIAIGNGRFPSVTSPSAETAANKEFERVYNRKANLSNVYDKAALTIAAYGLRPNPRNTNSETVAIKSFKWIYGKAPSSSYDWDIVRVIAYSGAKR